MTTIIPFIILVIFISVILIYFKIKKNPQKNSLQDIETKLANLLPENCEINYGVVSYYHHTVIPKVFQSLYKGLLGNYIKNLNFIEIDWNQKKAMEMYRLGKLDVSLQSISLAIEGRLLYNNEKNENLPYYCYPLFDVNEQSFYMNREFLIRKSKLFSKSENEKINEILNNDTPRESYKLWKNLSKETVKSILHDSRIVYDEGFDLKELFKNFCDKYDIDKAEYKNITEESIASGIETKKDIGIILNGETDVWGTGTIQSYFLDKKEYYKDKVVKICSGKDFGVHSPNGLIFSKKFFDENVDIYRRLADMWFISMNFLRSYLHYVFDKEEPKQYDIDNIQAILLEFNNQLEVSLDGKELEVDKEFLKDFIIDIDPEVDDINSSFFLMPEDANYYTFNTVSILESVIKQVQENFPKHTKEAIELLFYRINPHFQNNGLIERDLYLSTWKK